MYAFRHFIFNVSQYAVSSFSLFLPGLREGGRETKKFDNSLAEGERDSREREKQRKKEKERERQVISLIGLLLC